MVLADHPTLGWLLSLHPISLRDYMGMETRAWKLHGRAKSCDFILVRDVHVTSPWRFMSSPCHNLVFSVVVVRREQMLNHGHKQQASKKKRDVESYCHSGLFPCLFPARFPLLAVRLRSPSNSPSQRTCIQLRRNQKFLYLALKSLPTAIMVMS